MCKMRRYCGFSLLEVLLAIGTLSVGMIFIGGTFLVAIHFTGVSAERTTATVVANEAFAKIRIFGVDMSVGDPNLGVKYSNRYGFEVPTVAPFAPDEFAYPSTSTLTSKKYFWSALCRRDPNDPLRDEPVAFVVEEQRKKIKYACNVCKPSAGYEIADLPCVKACPTAAITHSW